MCTSLNKGSSALHWDQVSRICNGTGSPQVTLRSQSCCNQIFALVVDGETQSSTSKVIWGEVCLTCKHPFEFGLQSNGWKVPATPEICMFWVEHLSLSDWANLSDMKEADEPESRRPQALVEEPLGAWMSTWHVMRSVLQPDPDWALLETSMIVLVCSSVGGSDSVRVFWDFLTSTWRKMWWGRWHFLQWLLLLSDVSRPEAVETEVVLPDCGKHFVMWQCLELLACVQWVFLWFAHDAAWVCCSCSRSQRIWMCLLPEGCLLISDQRGFLSCEHDSEAWALRFRNSKSFVYWGTSLTSWLNFCHSNKVAWSSFSYERDVMNGPEGSFPMALSAHSCC